MRNWLYAIDTTYNWKFDENNINISEEDYIDVLTAAQTSTADLNQKTFDTNMLHINIFTKLRLTGETMAEKIWNGIGKKIPFVGGNLNIIEKNQPIFVPDENYYVQNITVYYRIIGR